MGLKVSKVNVNHMTGMEVAEKSKSKALKDIKVMDLPIENTTQAKRQWDTLIGLLIDWAGTTDDPFGTNENPDLMPTIQELWNRVFGAKKAEVCLDVTMYPAIKKIVSVHPEHAGIIVFMNGLVTGVRQTQHVAQRYWKMRDLLSGTVFQRTRLYQESGGPSDIREVSSALHPRQ